MNNSEISQSSIRLRKRIAKISLLISLPPILIVGCQKPAEDEEQAGGPPISLVALGKVELRNISPEVTVIGTVTARNISVVASGADGVVDKFLVEEGQFVKQGEELSQLRTVTTDLEIKEAEAVLVEKKQKWQEMKSSRPEDIEASRARMKAAEVVRDNMALRLKRVDDAFRKKAVNEDEYEDAQEKSKAAEQLYLAAKATYESIQNGPRKEQTEQAKAQYDAQTEQVKFLKAEKEKRTTKAPFPGYVIKEGTYVGQWLSKGDPVVNLARLDEVDVIVNVDQDKLKHVQIGKNARVLVSGYKLSRITLKNEKKTIEGTLLSRSMTEIVLSVPNGDTTSIPKSNIAKEETIPWSGKVVQIIPRSEWESGSRGFPIKVRIKNHLMKVETSSKTTSLVPVLKEGMMAQVSFFGKKIQALMVHKDCLITTNRGINIHLYTPSKENASSGSTMQIAVELGESQRNYTQVIPISNGMGEAAVLKPGQFVVTEGGERLRPVQGNVKVIEKAFPAPKKSIARTKPK